LVFVLIDILMGICSNEQVGEAISQRKPAADLSIRRQAAVSHVLTSACSLFQIKEWPGRHSVDLHNPQEAFSRTMKFSLFRGERVDITLKTHLQEAGGDGSNAARRVPSGDGLHCVLRRTSQYYQLDFPIKQEREAVWEYTCGWMFFSVGDTVRMGNSRHTLRKLMIADNRELEELRQTLHRTASQSFRVSQVQDLPLLCGITRKSFDFALQVPRIRQIGPSPLPGSLAILVHSHPRPLPHRPHQQNCL
jgi:hypothetical protein